MKTINMLRAVVGKIDELEAADKLEGHPQLGGRTPRAFRDMLRRWEEGSIEKFSKSQVDYIHGVYERVFDEPVYENARSSGKVPRGAVSTPVPEVLQRPLPLKPPGRG